ncbi:hypothetical protein B0H16DRAFT_1455060 [Mycena metata]|uniref:Uncharacterized protein n=1 Tax=Mycena metata TaxID=1033252 RepID=A0AAD7JG99_9AGAR|nr:hypothetical protein B0H16DRAFT_1455060 [Mycena metata]
MVTSLGSVSPVRHTEVGLTFLETKRVMFTYETNEINKPRNADSLSLARSQKVCWFNDLRIVLSRLHIPVHLDISQEFTVQLVETAMKDVRLSMEAWVESEIESSSRVRDLLVGRLEIDNETHRLVKKSLDYRHYLRVKTGDHRRAQMENLTSQYLVQRVNAASTARQCASVPRQMRVTARHMHTNDAGLPQWSAMLLSEESRFCVSPASSPGSVEPGVRVLT